MAEDLRLESPRFPRASRYHPEWVLAHASGGANALWLAEWLTASLDLRPGMRVLDLGCGRASTSIFLHREFGVQVWVLYLNYLAQFVKPSGPIGVAGAGLVREVEGQVPAHLQAFWTQDVWAFHSPPWWRHHWERTGIVDIDVADAMPDGWQRWLEWQRVVAPDNAAEIAALEADGGAYLGYVRIIGHRRGDATLESYCWPDTMRSLPVEYTRQPLLRTGQR